MHEAFLSMYPFSKQWVHFYFKFKFLIYSARGFLSMYRSVNNGSTETWYIVPGSALKHGSVNNGSSGEKAATMAALHHWHGSNATLYALGLAGVKTLNL